MLNSILLIGLSMFSAAADDDRQKEVAGTVLAVVDGDTFILVADETRHQFKVRLLGIDAPEKKQLYGMSATEKLRDLIQDRRARIEYRRLDRDGRVLGDVYVMGKRANEEWINLIMVKEGLAWHAKDVDRRKSLANAETEAREAKRGLWEQQNPVPPWEWLKEQKRRSDL